MSGRSHGGAVGFLHTRSPMGVALDDVCLNPCDLGHLVRWSLTISGVVVQASQSWRPRRITVKRRDGQSRRTVPVLDQVRMARCVSPWATITRGPQLTSGDPSQSWGRSRHQLPSSELAHGETHVFPVVLNENKRLPACNVALSLIVFPFSVCEDNGVVPHISKISSPTLPTTG